METFVFPIYVRGRDDGRITEYPNLAAMQQHLEAIDVENEEFEAWDARGQSVKLEVGEPKSEWLKIVTMQNQLSEEHFTELRSKAEKWRPYVPVFERLACWIQSRTKG